MYLNDDNMLNPHTRYNFLIYLFCAYFILRASCVMLGGFELFSMTFVTIAAFIAIALCYHCDLSFRSVFSTKSILLLLICIVYLFFVRLAASSSRYITVTNSYINSCILLLAMWGIYSIVYRSDAYSRKKLGTIYLVGIIVSAIYTTFVCLNGPDLIIRMTAEGVYYYDLFPFRYGSYDFIYLLVILYVAFYSFLRSYSSRLRVSQKIIIISILVLFAVLITVANYTTAFILILAFSIYDISSNRKLKFIFLAIFVIMVFFIPNVLTELIDLVPGLNDLTKIRVQSVILSFSGQGMVDDYAAGGARSQRILASLRVLQNYPVFGGYIHNTDMEFGGHTEWIDRAAQFGLIFIVPFASYMIKSFKNIKAGLNNSPMNDVVKYVWLIVFILGFIDPISIEVTIAPLFIFIPFMPDLFGVNEY